MHDLILSKLKEQFSVLPRGECSAVEEDADLLVREGVDDERDAAAEDGAAVEGVAPFEGDLHLVRRDLLLQGDDLVEVTRSNLKRG